MREIEFRGKRVDNDEWVYGGIYLDHGKAGIMTTEVINASAIIDEVDAETIGQFTGRYDRKGKKVFENDKVRMHLRGGYDDGYIRYDETRVRFVFVAHDGEWSFDESTPCEVIGNIHDNPEISEGGDSNSK